MTRPTLSIIVELTARAMRLQAGGHLDAAQTVTAQSVRELGVISDADVPLVFSALLGFFSASMLQPALSEASRYLAALEEAAADGSTAALRAVVETILNELPATA